MPVRNQEWYNYCESVPYPVDDTVSRIGETGTRLPHNIVADLNLQFPSTLGAHVFIGACAVTEHLVTLVLLGSQSALLPEAVTPIAAVTLPRPVNVHQPYAVSPLAAGVGGWIVFGSGIEHAYQGRFSSPAQTRLCPRAVRAYQPLPVTDIGKLNHAQPLTGIVQLLGGNDIEIVSELRELSDNVTVQALIVRLADTNLQPVARNLYDAYRGPCGTRPESGTCPDPQPIEQLGSVGPDADGVITLVFEGALSLSAIHEAVLTEEGEWVPSTEVCGATVDFQIGLATACGNSSRLPDADGRLPNEGDGECSFVSISLNY